MICKLIKLNTGESIIASVMSETSTYIEVHRAIKILMTPKGTESYAILMVKWDPSMDFEVPVRVLKNAIVSIGEPEEQFKKSYMEVYEEYDLKNAFLEDEVDIKTVDDLANEIDNLFNMLNSSANNTLH